MRLKFIILEGFRGFAERAEIDLDSDVIILHGPNGAGKTSLLDGILWCLTGKIERFADRGGPISLYAREGIARVELSLRADSEDVTVVRAYDGERMTVRVTSKSMAEEGPAADRALAAVLFPGLTGRQDSSSALSDVLTRGVYLQQDLVRQFVESDLPTARFAVLSEIVGAGILLDLQQTLEKSRGQWSRTTTSLRREQLEPLEARQSVIEEQLSRLSEDSASPSFDARSASTALFEQAKLLLGGARLSLTVAPTTSGELDRFLRELDVERSRTERELATLILLQDETSLLAEASLDDLDPKELEAEEAARLEDVATLDTAIQAALAELAELRERQVAEANRASRLAIMAQVALEELGDVCPVCEQAFDAEHTTAHLRELIVLASAPLETKVVPSLDTQTLSFQRARAVQQLEEVRTHRSDMRERLAAQAARRAQHEERLRYFGIEDSSGVKMAIETQRTRVEVTLTELTSLIKGAEQLTLSVVRLGEQRRRAELLNENSSVTKRVVELQQEVASLEQTHAIAGNIIEGLREASMAVTEAQVRRVAPLFQRIYSRIDPHPTFRVTEILARRDRGRGHITVGVTDPREKLTGIDAGPLLSSSQLNSFALSLFLALNLSMRTTRLGLTILDDPLQSLDSINLLGLVDVLRRIREHRQILVSTHEDRLLGLLQRKLRPVRSGQRMVTITFSDWTRTGPSFQVAAITSDGAEARVIAA